MASTPDPYQDLLDDLYYGVYSVDRDRVITHWNKGPERITGYPAARAVGRSGADSLLSHVTAKRAQLCLDRCPLTRVMEEGRARQAEVFLHHAEGHLPPVLVRGSALRDGGGRIVGAAETVSSTLALTAARREVRELRQAGSPIP